jgi:hypothetical protein
MKARDRRRILLLDLFLELLVDRDNLGHIWTLPPTFVVNHYSDAAVSSGAGHGHGLAASRDTIGDV